MREAVASAAKIATFIPPDRAPRDRHIGTHHRCRSGADHLARHGATGTIAREWSKPAAIAITPDNPDGTDDWPVLL
jgi:hypothetical protein